MDKLKHFWTLLFVAFAMCACDPSDPEGGDEVRIIGDNSFTVEADATTVNGGAPIAFVASGEWNAAPVGEAAEWLTVTPESGAAGDNEITIACQPNTGSPRDGKVRIVCGESAAEITIHQKGVGGTEPDPDPKPDPVTPLKGQVSRIMFNAISESGDFGDEGSSKSNWDFTYDDQNRISVINIEVVDDGYGDSWTENFRFDYSEPGKIKGFYGTNDEYGENQFVYEMSLDDAGRVNGLTFEVDNEKCLATANYDDAGHLSSIIEEYDNSRDEYHYSWDGGVLATITEEVSWNHSWKDVEDFTGRYGDLPNGAMNIDPNIFFMDGGPDGPFIVTLLFRMMGASSDRLIAVTDHDNEPPYNSGPASLSKPNMTKHFSEEISYEGYDNNLYYDADPDGLVHTITQYREDIVTLVEYDMVSSDRMVDYEYPEYGYICEMENYTWKIISRKRNGTRNEVKFEYRAN